MLIEIEMKALKLSLLLSILVALSGCETATKRGDYYRSSGEYRHEATVSKINENIDYYRGPGENKYRQTAYSLTERGHYPFQYSRSNGPYSYDYYQYDPDDYEYRFRSQGNSHSQKNDRSDRL